MGLLQANCHFLYDQEIASGLVVDPGGDAEEILRLVETSGVKLGGILLTHGHGDHIAATAELVEATGASVYGSAEAEAVLASPDDYVLFPGMPSFREGKVDHLVNEDGDLTVAGLAVGVVTTPGHTAGSLTFFINRGLYCGDLLFRGSVGRTDLAGGSFDQLAASVRKLILTYPGDTAVYPGHGSSTTLQKEQESNPFFTDLGW